MRAILRGSDELIIAPMVPDLVIHLPQHPFKIWLLKGLQRFDWSSQPANVSL
jgi:hypothetical protein